MRIGLLSVLAVICCAGSAAPAEPASSAAEPSKLSSLASGKWNVLDQGDALTRVLPRLVWLPDEQVAFNWPNLNYHTRAYSFEDHARARFFSPESGSWEFMPAGYRGEGRIHPSVVAHSCVYLPGLKKVLLVMPSDRISSGVEAVSWLFDPRTCEWEPVGGRPAMADDPTAFGAAASQAGQSVPLLSRLVYDAHNKEAVLIGGGMTWGRVGRKEEHVQVGDWIFDERAKRIRRLTDADADVARARKWYPAQCGTWLFSEKTLKWHAIDQPLREQPSGRVLTSAAYAPAEKKIVLFGGDDYSKCLHDTWLYDCADRTWRRDEVESATAPTARAFAGMTTVGAGGAVLLAGGYGPGWKALQDAWIFDVSGGEWKRLKSDLPAPAAACSADYDPGSGAVLVSFSDSVHRAKTEAVCAIRLEGNSAETFLPAPTQIDAEAQFHCKAADDWYVPLPHEWNAAENKGRDPEVGRRELAALPANQWVKLDAPMKARARQWGSYTYDARTHTAYAWGGGHYGYVGNEVDEFNVLAARWRSQVDPPAYKPRWWHGAGGGGGTTGVGFQGWRLMGIHARKSYAVDVASESLITVHGDAYDLKRHQTIGNIGRCPGSYGLAQQECFLNTPHGLYAFGLSRQFGPVMHRALVREGKWEQVAQGGDPQYSESSHVCYDSRRDRMICINAKTADVWTFDFATKKWTHEKPTGAKPAKALGDSCYIPELDAALMVFADQRRGEETLHLYKCDEKKWYTSPYQGEMHFSNSTGRDSSPFYDPELQLVVRLAHNDRGGWVDVLVMRLDPDTFQLAELD